MLLGGDISHAFCKRFEKLEDTERTITRTR